jgi:hypothetical protein
MEHKQTEQKPQKSTLLLIVFLFILFNAVQLFRSGVTSRFFTEDISGDYASVEATLVSFKTNSEENSLDPPQSIPVFSFVYKEEQTTLDAPNFAFDATKRQIQPFQIGAKYSLWVHKRWGQLIVPPVMGPEERGRSQMKISGLFLFLAVAVWILRNKLAKRKSIVQ